MRDSKLLTPEQRESLFKKIIKLADSYEISIIEPQEIDSRNAVGTNLNRLEALKAAEIIKVLNPDKVIVDSPEPKANKFAGLISKHLINKPEILAEHKADFKYPVVSAASILAKVIRDKKVREIEKEIGCLIGSGYQADPICKEFLDKHLKPEHEKFLRKCWITYREIKKNREQRSLGEF